MKTCNQCQGDGGGERGLTALDRTTFPSHANTQHREGGISVQTGLLLVHRAWLSCSWTHQYFLYPNQAQHQRSPTNWVCHKEAMTGHKAHRAQMMSCCFCIRYRTQQGSCKVPIFSCSGLEPTLSSQELDTANSLWQKVTFQQPASKCKHRASFWGKAILKKYKTEI